MTLDDIYNLPIADIAADDCVLFLWVTFPLLREGLEAIRRWGFEYKTCAFNWVKRNKKSDSWFWGLGYWTRSNSELCLLATKGSPPVKANRYIRFAMRVLCVTVKSLRKSAIVLLHCAAICHEPNYLHASKQMGGLVSATRLTEKTFVMQ